MLFGCVCWCPMVPRCQIFCCFSRFSFLTAKKSAMVALNLSGLLAFSLVLSFCPSPTHTKMHPTHTLEHKNTAHRTSPLKARKTNMPIFLFDWVSAWGGRGTGVMHKMTLRLHHAHDSFMVRRCFNHAAALEGINQYRHTHTHTNAHATVTPTHIHLMIPAKRAAELLKYAHLHRHEMK